MDVARLREETPGCANVLHFNNAGASLMPKTVFDRVHAHLTLELEVGGYEAAAIADDETREAYSHLARLVNAMPHEIAIVENATRAWDMAFYGLPLSRGDRIITTESSYASNFLAFIQTARRVGAIIDIIPSDEYGQVDTDALRRAIAPDTKLIALTHVATNGGLVNPARAVGKVAREYEVPYLLDACQSVGQMPVDVDDIGCDMLSATGRKFLRGPRGTGFLYVREDFLDRLLPPFVDLRAALWAAPDRYHLRADARRFETWEGNVAAKLGLGVAARYATELGVDAVWKRVSELAAMLRVNLEGIPSITVHDQGNIKCGIVTFSSSRLDAADLTARLRARNVNTSVSTASSTLLDASRRRLPRMVRASVHYYNTGDEVRTFCEHVNDLSQLG